MIDVTRTHYECLEVSRWSAEGLPYTYVVLDGKSHASEKSQLFDAVKMVVQKVDDKFGQATLGGYRSENACYSQKSLASSFEYEVAPVIGLQGEDVKLYTFSPDCRGLHKNVAPVPADV